MFGPARSAIDSGPYCPALPPAIPCRRAPSPLASCSTSAASCSSERRLGAICMCRLSRCLVTRWQGSSNASWLLMRATVHLCQSCPHFAARSPCSVALSLMRNFGLIGGTSRALGALSAALAKLAAGPAQ